LAWLVLDGDVGRVILDGDAGRVVLDGSEGSACISTSGAILSGNATSSFPSSPLRLGFVRMSWLRSLFLFECSIWLGGASFLDLGVVGASGTARVVVLNGSRLLLTHILVNAAAAVADFGLREEL
jgi:hypothetical protein